MSKYGTKGRYSRLIGIITKLKSHMRPCYEEDMTSPNDKRFTEQITRKFISNNIFHIPKIT